MSTKIIDNLDQPSQHIFNELQAEVLNVLQTDSLPKFYRSDVFQALRPIEEKYIEFMAPKALGLLNAFKSFISQYKSATEAEALAASLQAIASECAHLYREKKITRATLLADLKEPVHKLCDVIIDGYEIPFAFNPSVLREAIGTVQTELQKILKSHLNPERMQELNRVFALITDEELEFSFFEKKKWNETKEVGVILRALWDANII